MASYSHIDFASARIIRLPFVSCGRAGFVSGTLTAPLYPVSSLPPEDNRFLFYSPPTSCQVTRKQNNTPSPLPAGFRICRISIPGQMRRKHFPKTVACKSAPHTFQPVFRKKKNIRPGKRQPCGLFGFLIRSLRVSQCHMIHLEFRHGPVYGLGIGLVYRKFQMAERLFRRIHPFRGE